MKPELIKKIVVIASWILPVIVVVILSTQLNKKIEKIKELKADDHNIPARLEKIDHDLDSIQLKLDELEKILIDQKIKDKVDQTKKPKFRRL